MNVNETDDRRALRDAQAAARCALDGHTWARRRRDDGKLAWRCVCCHVWQQEVARGR